MNMKTEIEASLMELIGKCAKLSNHTIFMSWYRLSTLNEQYFNILAAYSM